MSTSVHIMALDSVVNVNSLFTLGLFLGLSWHPIAALSACPLPPSAAAGLVSFHVCSFAAFLFSNLVASALKQAIRTCPHPGPGLSRPAFCLCMLVSGLGSAAGCAFLLMALVDLVRIKLGSPPCGGLYALAALVPLVVLVPLGLVVYVSLGFHAFTR